MDYSNPWGVNNMGKNIKKSPVHQPNFANTNSGARPQPPRQVYNINKNDFRNIVQQLTGSPSQQTPSRPPQNPSKSPSTRLQRIRPAPLMPMDRPHIPIHPHLPQFPAQPSGAVPCANSFVRPSPPYGQPPSPVLPPFSPTDIWANTAESPISAYMQYLQTSIMDLGPKQSQPPGPMCIQVHQSSSGFLPNPLPSPRLHGPPLPSPWMNADPSIPSPQVNGAPPPLLSPGINSLPLLPSPTSQFLLPSPTGFLNFFPPCSPCLLLSPGVQHPPPLTPNFFFSPIDQPGILGPGPHPPLSPGYGFPLSPSGFLPISGQRWRDQ